MMTGDITFRTCQGCQNRSLTCRKDCAGWQYREQEKAARYEARAEWVRSSYRSEAKARAMRKQILKQKCGNGFGFK